MRPGTYFELEFKKNDGDAARQLVRAESESEVLLFARTNLSPDSELLVACLGSGVDFGNMIIEVNALGRSDVRAHEHRGFLAKDIPVGLAIEALAHWLPSQDRLPGLHWLEE